MLLLPGFVKRSAANHQRLLQAPNDLPPPAIGDDLNLSDGSSVPLIAASDCWRCRCIRSCWASTTGTGIMWITAPCATRASSQPTALQGEGPQTMLWRFSRLHSQQGTTTASWYAVADSDCKIHLSLSVCAHVHTISCTQPWTSAFP